MHLSAGAGSSPFCSQLQPGEDSWRGSQPTDRQADGGHPGPVSETVSRPASKDRWPLQRTLDVSTAETCGEVAAQDL